MIALLILASEMRANGPPPFFYFLVSYVGKRPWWPKKTPKREERRKRELRKVESDQIKFIDLRFERWQVVRFRKATKRQDVP